MSSALSLNSISAPLRPSLTILEFLRDHNNEIKELSHELDVSNRYLHIQTLLLLPKYSIEQLSRDSNSIFESIVPHLVILSNRYKEGLNEIYTGSKIANLRPNSRIKGRHKLYAVNKLQTQSVQFNQINDKEVSNIIQDYLHYIGSPREDEVISCGLFLDGAKIPYAFASFGSNPRRYQVDALNASLKLSLEPEEIIIMARAFSFDGAPVNSMSKLFYKSHNKIKERFPKCKAVITAINPFLGFSGSIFSGSNYYPYALSPMQYRYDELGFYVPRSKGITSQKMRTPPIVWLVHGLQPDIARRVEDQSRKIIHISTKEYENG